MINKLITRIKETNAPIVVGLDPMMKFVPEYIKKAAFTEYGETLEGAAEAIWQYNKGIVDAIYDLVPAVKPQVAMYEQFGIPGMVAFKKTVDYCKEKGLIVIGDIKRGDIRMANLETTVTDGTCFASAFSGGTWLTVDKSCLLDIKRYGFNMLGLANNHSMDYSYEGLNMTIDNVNKAGFFYAGSGKNLYEAARPAMIETKNGRVGVIDICSTFENAARAGSQTPRIPGRPGLNALRTHNLYKITKEHAAYLEEINKNTGLNSLREKHRAQGFIPSLAENRMEFGTMEFTIVDSNEQEGRWSYSDKRDVERTLNGIKEALYTCEAVVIMIHSHEIKADQEYEADYFMEEFAHACIDAGACAVVGSGTHQMKGIEFYKDCPIFYCLGNFIFENEFVRDLPADYMEKYGLPESASGAEGIAKRSAKAKKTLYTIPEVYQTVIPYFEIIDGKCVKTELLPVSLGFYKERYKKNLPYVADEIEALAILEYLNRACRPYGVEWCYSGGIMIRSK